MGRQCFSLLKNQKKLLLNFCKILWTSYNNGIKKDLKFVKQFWKWIFKICNKKWYIIDTESKGNYSHENSIKFLTSSLESILYDYSDAYVLVTGHTAVEGADDDTKVALKNCAPFRKWRT